MATEVSTTKAVPDPPAPAVDWRKLHALGMPAGSVRALLAVMIFATVWSLLAFDPSREVPDYLRDLLFVIMGHYFATRRKSDQQQQDGKVEAGPPPLYLPNGTVRLVLVAGCAGVAALLYRRGQLTAFNPGVVTLLLVGGFLVGVGVNAAAGWWREKFGRRHRVFEDLQALVAVAAGAALVALVWNRLYPVYPPDLADHLFARWFQFGRYGPENALAALVGFYFGSRS